MTAFTEYLAEIGENLAHGDATEHTHRPALKKLLELVGQGITATNEPTRILCGAPDFNITKGKVPLGHVETKDIGENLVAMEKGKPPSVNSSAVIVTAYPTGFSPTTSNSVGM